MSWPDSIPHHLLVQLIRKYFPFQSIGLDSFRKLPSYCDAMYYFTGTLAAPKARQEEFVLKLLNPEDSKDLDIQNGLARLGTHITGKGFTCPCPVQSHAGNLVVLQRSTLLEYLSTGIMGDLVSSTGADSSDEPRCCVSIYRYIPGKIDSDRVMKHSPQFLYKTGSYVASLDKQLMVTTYTYPIFNYYIYSSVIANAPFSVLDNCHIKIVQCHYYLYYSSLPYITYSILYNKSLFT